MNDTEEQHKRKYLRFNPDDPKTIALISLSERHADFEVDIYALITNEAHGGCGLAFRNTAKLVKGSRCIVKVGELSPILAEVAWIRSLDEDIVKAGIKFLE